MRYFLLLVYFFCLCLLVPEAAVSSELVMTTSVKEQSDEYVLEDDGADEQGIFHFLLGHPANDSIYLGMWSYHVINDDESYQNTHNLIGVTYKGVFAGTFENSHDNRTWAVGFQRDVYQTVLGELSMDVGYRLGLMHGYDKMEIGDTGIFPLLQLYSDIRYKKVGVQLSWAGSVVTAGLFLRF